MPLNQLSKLFPITHNPIMWYLNFVSVQLYTFVLASIHLFYRSNTKYSMFLKSDVSKNKKLKNNFEKKIRYLQ